MDPQLHALELQLADTAVRNTARSVIDRIAAIKARHRDEDTITELEEIINNLLTDKSELVRIAQAYEQELIAQRISDDDIQYISANFIPLIQQVAAASPDEDNAEVERMINLVRPLLSVETVTILQLVGFNFRKAVGEPLTEFISRFISSKAQVAPSDLLEIQRRSLDVALDADAYARLCNMQRGGPQS